MMAPTHKRLLVSWQGGAIIQLDGLSGSMFNEPPQTATRAVVPCSPAAERPPDLCFHKLNEVKIKK
jgi:hypothetical protein